MSDVPQGDGWWLAVDGKYYPPEQHPDAVRQPPPVPPVPPAPTVPTMPAVPPVGAPTAWKARQRVLRPSDPRPLGRLRQRAPRSAGHRHSARPVRGVRLLRQSPLLRNDPYGVGRCRVGSVSATTTHADTESDAQGDHHHDYDESGQEQPDFRSVDHLCSLSPSEPTRVWVFRSAIAGSRLAPLRFLFSVCCCCWLDPWGLEGPVSTWPHAGRGRSSLHVRR
jgi:hypothetical protein